MATYFAKARRGRIHWRIVDAEGWVLGRLAARAARVLTGKDSPDYTPHEDHRSGLIIINAEKIRLTGKKLDEKVYRHTYGISGRVKRDYRARAFCGQAGEPDPGSDSGHVAQDSAA